MYPRFGTDINYHVVIEKMVDRIRSPLNGFQTAIYLREQYESMHGFADLDAPNRPLALVAENARDGNRRMSMRYKRYEDYRIYHIWDHYKLTLDKFVELPTADIEWMIERIVIENERMAKVAEKAKQEAEK